MTINNLGSALVIIMSFLQVVYPTEGSLHCVSHLYVHLSMGCTLYIAILLAMLNVWQKCFSR